MEYFATNTVISDYQKAENFIPHGEPEIRCITIKELQGMDLIVNIFPDPHLHKRNHDLVVTFIENEFSEDILLNTQVGYPKTNEFSSTYYRIYLGGANWEQLNLPIVPLRKPPIYPYSVAGRSIAMDDLTTYERQELENMAIRSRIRLRNQMKLFYEGLLD